VPKTPSTSHAAVRPLFLTTFVLVFGAIAALFAIDMFLAKVERAETAAQAARLYNEGKQLAAAGRYNNAIVSLRAALAISRDNTGYQLALANALLSAGKLDDTESLLRDLLQHDATDGQANLLMARALARQQRIAEAESYYHMAIYGRWPRDAGAHRIEARFELIDLLVKIDAKQELLAELLPLQDEPLTDSAMRARVARLFLLAGSPARAADIFRQIVRHEHQDGDAYAGLGEAEFARGNYRTAESVLVVALRLKPGDAQLRKDLEVSDEVVGMDPTARGLTPAQRLARSRKLVQALLDDARKCNLPATARPGPATDANFATAEKLWQARKASCPGSPPSPALAIVMDKIAE